MASCTTIITMIVIAFLLSLATLFAAAAARVVVGKTTVSTGLATPSSSSGSGGSNSRRLRAEGGTPSSSYAEAPHYYHPTLPSFTMVLGPIVSLSLSTGGALLSMEDNVAVRRNTVSGLQYAVEYCLNSTFIGGSASSYFHYYVYANIDKVEYVQNASVPNNDDDAVAADGSGGGGDEYIAVLVSGRRIYMK
jgi:hypothetical protein